MQNWGLVLSKVAITEILITVDQKQLDRENQSTVSKMKGYFAMLKTCLWFLMVPTGSAICYAARNTSDFGRRLSSRNAAESYFSCVNKQNINTFTSVYMLELRNYFKKRSKFIRKR